MGSCLCFFLFTFFVLFIFIFFSFPLFYYLYFLSFFSTFSTSSFHFSFLYLFLFFLFFVHRKLSRFKKKNRKNNLKKISLQDMEGFVSLCKYSCNNSNLNLIQQGSNPWSLQSFILRTLGLADSRKPFTVVYIENQF